ncbi:MAG: SDR family oxidoreductase [Planctomycetes bacterium]|nr:SDR family oxidoreductase [Planctomycetota bacterium]
MLDRFADRWALVTGASSGIGATFAEQLAARGMHLVLVARRREPMQELAARLHTQHGTRSEILTSDLAAPHQAAALHEAVSRRGIEIELLLNNAGFAVVGDAADVDVDRVGELVRLNIGALTDLTYRFLQPMLQRGHGAIVNVASVAAFQPVAYMAAYAASKSYVLHFSEGLWAETRDRGVTVMALCPGVTRTSFFDVAGVPGWLKKHRSQDPEKVVRNALTSLEKRRQYAVSGWGNWILSLLVRLATRRRVVIESMKYFRPQPKSEEPDAEATVQPPQPIESDRQNRADDAVA